MDILKNQEIIESYLSATNLPNIDKLLAWLNATDFYTAPASCKYHLCCDGGLAQHSLNVFNALFDFAFHGIIDYETEPIALAALLHDVCKIHMYEKCFKWRKNDNNEWEQYETYTINERFAYGHGEKSVYLVEQFVKLPYDVAQAIRAHMGFSDNSFKGGDKLIPNIFTENPLALYLSFADQHATFITEKES